MEATQHDLNPSKDYLKGFNHGYSLQRYEPEMVKSITKGIKDKNSDYAVGIQDGKAEMILEMEREKYPNKKTIPDRRKDIDQGLDR
ncbi:MAG: hypothetical protein RIC57_01295 [Balneola sp.]